MLAAVSGMRILMLSPHPTVSGPLPKHTPVLVEALRATGCQVQTLPWGRHGDDDSLTRRLLNRVRDIWDIGGRVRASRFDVLVIKTSHEWVSLLGDLPLLVATRRSSPAIVLQFHGGEAQRLTLPGSQLFKLLSWLLFKLSDGVLVLSSEEARAAAGFYPSGRFHAVVNPYVAPAAQDDCAPSRDSALHHRDHEPAEALLPPVPTILFAGRLITEKGVLDAVEALAVLRRKRSCRLIIAGRGSAEDELRRRVDALGLAQDVTLTGQLTGERLEAAYRNADIFVLPSYWPEGFPTAITEAMSVGLPVVTTQHRGMADHLQPDVNALFVTPRAPTELAAAIERLLDDGPLRARMSAANRAKVQDFAPAAAARLYLEALCAITGQATGA